ncbi:MAG: archease [Candidatus Saliniplasma sp.]
MSFEIVEHTADVGIHAKGKDLSEAFQEAARGMFSLITDMDKVEKEEVFKIELDSEEWDELLVDFLSELIYLHEVEDALFSDFRVDLISNDKKKLHAVVKGEKLDLNKHSFFTEIKAVSYHDILADPDGEVKVIFDV